MSEAAPASAPTDRTRLRRLPDRGHHDRATLHAILDEGLVCHVGFVQDGQPVVLPTGYVRDGDHLLLHGAKAGRLMRALASGGPVCVTVTLLDGLVLAKSGFNHSMNYRSVVAFGRAVPVPEAEREAALRTYMERLLPERWDALRPAKRSELLMTEVVRLPLDEASAKVRSGPPKDEEDDLPWPVWSGVLPMALAMGEPEPDSASKGVPGPLAEWAPHRR